MIRADLNKSGKRIVVDFPYDGKVLAKIKAIPGASWSKTEQTWTLPADLLSARKLRAGFKIDEITFGARMTTWGKELVKRERNLGSLSLGLDYPLEQMRVCTELPQMASKLWPHQRADIMFMSQASCINANEQGTGKTRDVIGAVYEAKLEHLPQLIVTPATSIEATWGWELKSQLPSDATIMASEDPAVRKRQIKLAAGLAAAGEPFWLVLNKGMVRYKAIYEWQWSEERGKDIKVEIDAAPMAPELHEISWGTFTVDEYHDSGLINQKTLGGRAFRAISADRYWAMSGTPMLGKPINLFGALNWLDPKAFRAKWRWIKSWLEVETDYAGFEHIKGIREGLEDEFYRYHSPYIVRRLKSEVFPELPPKEYDDVWCAMTPGQQHQYRTFEKDAEIRIEEYGLSASNILAEYARLKMFATAKCYVEGKIVNCPQCRGRGTDSRENECQSCLGSGLKDQLKLIPTEDSGKLPKLLAKLQECGVEPKEDQLGSLIFSQHKGTAKMIHKWLAEQGYRVDLISGDNKPGERVAIVQSFQKAGPKAPQIVVGVTKAMGRSLTLDRADSVHIMDETFVPDDQDQAEDRAHRGSRIHRVRIFTYRSPSTLEEKIKEYTEEKAWTNFDVLDFRRQAFRSIKEQK